jgi:hypothetical protein
MKHLLDTDTAIDFLNGRPQLAQTFRSLTNDGTERLGWPTKVGSLGTSIR